jgi:hypothetical protein
MVARRGMCVLGTWAKIYSGAEIKGVSPYFFTPRDSFKGLVRDVASKRLFVGLIESDSNVPHSGWPSRFDHIGV